MIHTPQDGRGGGALTSDGGGANSNHGGLEPRFNETFNGPFISKNGSKEDGTAKSNRRKAIQKSIDLQDYLNFSTGLDYRKVQAKKAETTITKREVQTSQVSAREGSKPGELLDKIAKNKFITDKDIDKQRYEDNEKKRLEKLNEIDEQLIKQNEQKL